MKYIATAALMLNLGVAGGNAQQNVKMTFSGTGGPSTINLQQPNTNNSEDNSAGNGTLGSFTFRNVRAIRASPEPSSSCSGPTQLYFSSLAGAGVFRRATLPRARLLGALWMDGGRRPHRAGAHRDHRQYLDDVAICRPLNRRKFFPGP